MLRRALVAAAGPRREPRGNSRHSPAPPGWHRACLVARRFDQHAHCRAWRRGLGNQPRPRPGGPWSCLLAVGAQSRGGGHHPGRAAEPAPPARRPAAHAADHHRFAGRSPARGRAGGAGRPLWWAEECPGRAAPAPARGADGVDGHPGPGGDRPDDAAGAGCRDVAAGAPRRAAGAGRPRAGVRGGPRPAHDPGAGRSRWNGARLTAGCVRGSKPAGADDQRRGRDGDRLGAAGGGGAGRRAVRGAGAGGERAGHDAGARLRRDHGPGPRAGRTARDVLGPGGAGGPGAGLRQRPVPGLAGGLPAGARDDGRPAAGRAALQRGRGLGQHGGGGGAGPGARRGDAAVRGAGAVPGQRTIGARDAAGAAHLGSQHRPGGRRPVTAGCVRNGPGR
jgi:hypothetical protein